LSLNSFLNAIIGRSLWKQQGAPQEASNILKEPQESLVNLLEPQKVSERASKSFQGASWSLKELSRSLREPQNVSIASD
jgi:hypothetical protein